MIDPLAPVGDGYTVLPVDVRDQVIPTYIAKLAELYEAEEENIALGTYGRAPTLDELLDDLYLRDLHHAMFDQVWRWAGRYRHHEVNIGGIDWRDVPVLVRYLVDDTKEWLDTELYGPVEIAVRFHHRLVQIHAFVNGNGRHGRFAADYLIEALGEPRFTWGAGLDRGRGELRARYRRALRSMDHDHDDVTDLLGFARS